MDLSGTEQRGIKKRFCPSFPGTKASASAVPPCLAIFIRPLAPCTDKIHASLVTGEVPVRHYWALSAFRPALMSPFGTAFSYRIFTSNGSLLSKTSMRTILIQRFLNWLYYNSAGSICQAFLLKNYKVSLLTIQKGRAILF